MLPPYFELGPRPKEPKPRMYGNPITFIRTLAKYVGQREEWDFGIENASVLSKQNVFALIGKMTPDIASTLIWVDPRLLPPEKAYAFAWSLGMIVHTRNFTYFGQEQQNQDTKPFILTFSKIDQEDLTNNILKSPERVAEDISFWASAFAALLLTDENVYTHYLNEVCMEESYASIATARSCGIPYELVRIWLKLQGVPKDIRDELMGMDPKAWAQDILGYPFVIKTQGPPLPPTLGA